MLYKKEFILLILVKVLFSFFAFFIYSNFSQLGDSNRYLNATLNFNNILDRTQFVDNTFAFLKYVMSSSLLVNISISVLFGYSFFYVFKDVLIFVDKKLLYMSFLLPSFQIWTSVAGKEIIAVIGFLFFIKWVINIQFGRDNRIHYLVIGILFGVFLRPHYGIAYIYLAISAIILSRIKFRVFSNGFYVLSLFIIAIMLFLVLALTVNIWSAQFLSVLDTIEGYFLAYDASNSNRYDIEWGTISDYFYNITWGFFISIIGPTLNETLNRVVYLPFFIEGILSFILMIVISYRLYKSTNENVLYRKLFYFSFLPALIIILMIHYPFGLFNPGSAIRYKQNITPLIYFYPLLMLACINKYKVKG
ncbi:hypothetical protein EGX44_08865 [Yersinia pseudotuberculosis]|nr:hypothetical protein EGX44_08865 [Yersinia pseudotuberculosis]